MTLLFSTSNLKYANKAFFIPNLGNFSFSQKFGIRQIPGFWFHIWQYCFQVPAPKYPNNAFLVPNSNIFVFHQKLAIWLNRGCWFQIREQFFKILALKYANQAFLVPNSNIFVFSSKICNLTKSRVLISNIVFKFQPKNTQIRHFWSQI